MAKRKIIVGALGLLTLTACAGGNAIDQAVPQAALSPLPAPAQPGQVDADIFPQAPRVTDPAQSIEASAPSAEALSIGSGGPRNTGTVPNVNVTPQGETEQITDAERAALISEMQALQRQQASGVVSTAAYKARLLYLQQLAKTHSKTTLNKIEAQ